MSTTFHCPIAFSGKHKPARWRAILAYNSESNKLAQVRHLPGTLVGAYFFTVPAPEFDE